MQGTRSNDDGSTIVNSTIVQPNGDIIRCDWRVEDVAGKTMITDLFVEGVSLRTTHRSDFASAIQSQWRHGEGPARRAAAEGQQPVAICGGFGLCRLARFVGPFRFQQTNSIFLPPLPSAPKGARVRRGRAGVEVAA